MTGDAKNLILDRLCRINGRLDTIQNDIRESKERLRHLERGQDRIDLRLERIERRLELSDA